MNYMLTEASKILLTENDLGNPYAINDVITVLEDAASPTTRKYHAKLFQSVIDKKHIDFGDIPKSAGRIRNYAGYQTMMETLDVLLKLTLEERNKDVEKLVKTVLKAIDNIDNLSSTYAKGFSSKTDYVMLEYNTYVYTCVEATTTLLYEFIDYVRRPDQMTFKITLRNTNARANKFYFDQLTKFNNVHDRMSIEYRKMLEALCEKGRDNFLGIDDATVIGVAAVSVVALAIVPITRELIYQFYRLRGNISAALEMQSTFLEMNQSCLEANTQLNSEDKKKIMEKQVKTAKTLRRLSEKIKVKEKKGLQGAQTDLKKDNQMLSLKNLDNEIADSPLQFF